MYGRYLCRYRFGWARKALGADEPRVIKTAEEALALWSAEATKTAVTA